MADLSVLRELYAWMRSENIAHARVGKLELRLGSPIAPIVVLPTPVAAAPPPAADDDDERRDLEALLHSSGGDVDSLHAMVQRTRARQSA